MVAKVPVDIDWYKKTRSPQHYSQNIQVNSVKVDLSCDGAEFILRNPVSIHHSVLPRKHLPPTMRPAKENSFVHIKELSKEKIEEIKLRREQDPEFWTVGMLSKEFNVSPKGIMILTGGSPALKERKRALFEKELNRVTNQSIKKTVAEMNRERAKWEW